MTKAQIWHDAVFDIDGGRCGATQHDPRCRGFARVAHHICYRSHIPKWCYWIVNNGIALSEVCHTLAHRTKNANIASERKREAVDAVNNAIPEEKKELRVPYFLEAA
jgi:hypothetical protein